MSVHHQVFPNLYQDSVSLMQISATLSAADGIEQASVVMGSEANLTRLSAAGFGDISARPADLVIAVIGEDEACAQAIAHAESLLKQKHSALQDSDAPQQVWRSSEHVCSEQPQTNMALISVPGQYAVAETIKALNLGLNVMLFSDNIGLSDELALKQLAESKQRIVMGPDCGTAIINGLPLGFANVVRRGRIGVVAASGTGMQEVTCRIHALGAGISQAIGTGGHDLHESIGGLSMLRGLRTLADDPDTDVIVLVSKPPAANVAEHILSQAKQAGKPVVVLFLGADMHSDDQRIIIANTLAEAADKAVAALHGNPAATPAASDTIDATLPSKRRYLRAVFAGGTFCYEAQLIAQQHGITAASNTPVSGNPTLDAQGQSAAHLIIDMGDDMFTQGRPHPMIDPTLRNQRIAAEAKRDDTAVVLFDVVLGYGAAADPLADLLPIIHAAQQQAEPPLFIAHVCGTDSDPQNRDAICDSLRQAGVIVAAHNADAARLAAYIIATKE
ncbi:acyl-CoA synthetase FdrA [Cardiobacteriaceae bacterium TAE3-ERU3]|nr:acyl-CoA synthetase FdrA [Cardiobacteriaceae bacterium TAE3-ERU3]